MTHAPWCPEAATTESHATCRLAVGTVLLANGDTSIEIGLTKAVDVPAVLSLLLVEHGRAHVAVLNNERALEALTLLRIAFDLMTGRPNG